MVENTHEPEQDDHDGEQHHERGDGKAGQHPAKDLQHEQGPGEHQDVHDTGEQAPPHTQPGPRRGKGLPQLALRDRVGTTGVRKRVRHRVFPH